MTKRLMILAAVLAAAIVAAGCGGSGPGGGATDDALSFMPKDAPVVATVETDPDGDQFKKANDLLGKFPFAGQVRNQLKDAANAGSSGLDFDDDIKPVLGNQLVFVVPSADALKEDDTPVLLALKAEDEGKAEELVKSGGSKVGEAEGSDIYQSDDTFIALKDGVIVAGDKQADVEAALKREGGDDHLSGDDLDDRLAGLEGDGLLNVGVDAEQLIAQSPDAADARKVKWVAGLRDVGFTLRVVDDGVEGEFKVTTENVSDADLPLASGSEAAPIVRRPSDVGLGARNLAQTFHFGEAAAMASSPDKFADYDKKKAQLEKALGIDIDRDVVAQFEGNASVSIGLDGGFAVRSDLNAPAKFTATLDKAAPKLGNALRGENVAIVQPKRPDRFYTLATADGKKYAFGVIDDRFVLATDAARAAQFASQEATPVPDAKGSLVAAMDTQTVANEFFKQQGQAAAGLFTGPIGDFTAWVETSTDGMSGRFKQVIE